MKKTTIFLAAAMLMSSCVVEDEGKDIEPSPQPISNGGDNGKGNENGSGNGNGNESGNGNGNGNESGNGNGNGNESGNGETSGDAIIVIDPYVADCNFSSEAEEKAASLVDNSIKDAIEYLRTSQYSKTYSLVPGKYAQEPARENLSDLLKTVYDSLYNCADRYEDFFYDGTKLDEGKNPITDKMFMSDFLTVYSSLRADHPEITQYCALDNLKSTRSKIYTEWIQPGGNGITSSSKESVKECREVFDAAISRVMNAMPKNLCEFDKYRYLATFICVHNSYDYSLKTVSAYWPCYNVIINQTAVCSGYAETFLYLCKQAGLWCERYDGTCDGGNHAWNLIKIDGKTYLCDCTFADSYTPGSSNWMTHFVQGEYERSRIGEYLDLDGKPIPITGEEGSLLWR